MMNKQEFDDLIICIKIFVISSLIILITQFIFIRSYDNVKISSAIEKTTNGNTEYILNIGMPDGKLNPVIVENVWWLGRFDRTTLYA